MEGAEGIGEAVTGGLIARAVEPEAGDATEHQGGACLNCGAQLIGDYCHQCGQQGHVHRTLGAFWHDLLHGVLHFEGKIWRTLPLLAWRPGELTRRYVEGERARFVSPMALFLFSVFLMFAVVNTIGGPFDADTLSERAEAEQEYRHERAETLKELQDLRAERVRLVAAGEATSEVDVDIRNSQAELALLDKLFKQAMALAAEEEKRETGLKKAAQGETITDDAKKVEFNTRIPWIDNGLKKANENPSLLLYKLQSNAYKFSWALIPISVPFVWLLFLHRRRYRQHYKAYDHVVFVTYSIAFMSLGFVLLTLLRPLGLGDVIPGLAITFIPPLHIYRQLRGAYQLSRFSALWRTFMLLIFASVASALFLALLLLLGVLG